MRHDGNDMKLMSCCQLLCCRIWYALIIVGAITGTGLLLLTPKNVYTSTRVNVLRLVINYRVCGIPPAAACLPCDAFTSTN